MEKGAAGYGSFTAEAREVKSVVPDDVSLQHRTGLERLFIPKRVQVPHQALEPLFDYMGVNLRG